MRVDFATALRSRSTSWAKPTSIPGPEAATRWNWATRGERPRLIPRLDTLSCPSPTPSRWPFTRRQGKRARPWHTTRTRPQIGYTGFLASRMGTELSGVLVLLSQSTGLRLGWYGSRGTWQQHPSLFSCGLASCHLCHK
ncbi:hypothetical protein TPAR_06933 [Tolypocladium paradoxum]|uniref:Uncharacterized protein n=1 Tax=Tolypocladium paradoxum TaxID=94208 RepID=A0A2S4KRS4_9HYPO|nr:hypothetical protein TPAR_06933 [Tolypocladium paradoxum]